MSTFGFLFYVTYQCLHHRLRLEASAVEECSDAAWFFCCKKNISGDKIINCDKLRNVIKPQTSTKKPTSHAGYFILQLGDTAVQQLLPRKTTWTCLSAILCVVRTHSLLTTGSQLCSSSGEEIKHICLPCLLTADKTRNPLQKN